MSLSTHQMGQSSWEDDSRLANQEIHYTLHKSVINYTFHNGPPLHCAFSQTNPRSKFTTIRSILILYSCFRPALPMHPLSFSLFQTNCTRFCFRRSKKKRKRKRKRKKENTQKQDFQLSLQYSSFGVTCPTQ